jgi:hypothetical protein
MIREWLCAAGMVGEGACGELICASRLHHTVLARTVREARFRLYGSREGEIVPLLWERSGNLIVMILSPIPVLVLVGSAAPVKILVAAMGFVLPLSVMAVLVRTPLAMRAATSQEWNHQRRRQQTTTKSLHVHSFRLMAATR